MEKEIIYITDSNGYGGAEKYLLDLAIKASDTFVTVSVALTPKDINKEFRRKLQDHGINVIGVQQYKAIYILNIYLALQFFLKHTRELFHFSLPSSHSCRWLLLVAALLKRRYFITEHSVLANPYRSGAYVFWAHLLFNPLMKLSFQRAEQVITVSETNRNVLIETYGMPANKLLVIHNGIDYTAFSTIKGKNGTLRREFNVREGSTVVVNVGRLTEEKGQRYLIEAFERLSKENPSSILILVGDGPLRSSLETDVKARQLTHSVSFAGFRDDIPDILQLADIFVLPSVLEGFPFVVLEAMAAGRPVIATDVGGNREAVLDGVTGTIIEPKNAEQLYTAISSLINSEVKRKNMGAKGAQRVKTFFSKEKMCQETLGLYGSKDT